MRNQGPLSALRILSLGLLLLAAGLAAFELVQYSRVRSYLPEGLRIAGVPVGGLDRQQAAQRLLEAYDIPVELRYGESVFQLQPDVVDFQLDIDSMLAAAEVQRTGGLFWEGFWDYLWGRSPAVSEIPLRASYSEPRLRDYLNEIARRYDQPPVPPLPIVGTVNFASGQQGTELDVDGSVLLIENALDSLTYRQVELPIQRTQPQRGSFQNLDVLLRQTLEVNNFEGIAGVYLMDLQTGQEIHFGYDNGQEIPVEPDIPFTASSIIKIPIMVSAFNHMEQNPEGETLRLVQQVIELSGNETADWLMDRVIDRYRGPLIVSDDMAALGLENTFLAGYFTLGSPLLAIYETPANQRSDIAIDIDPYSQTTPSDMGTLLADIYMCAQNGGGALLTLFPEGITRGECQLMIDHLVNNKLPSLLTGGLPEGTRIAHKHGWAPPGLVNTIGDAAIVYTPGGNYVIVTFLYHPVQLVWEPSSALVAELSRAVYNYYNSSQ